MKEKIDELLSDFKGRLKNPLILSFILVWLYWHWDLVYWILTVDSNISVYIRTSKITSYLEKENFLGMVLCPLLISFFSLAVYYLIANTSQFIQVWVGKRLNIAMLLKSDTGRYVERVTLEKEKKNNKDLKALLNGKETEIEQLYKDLNDYQAQEDTKESAYNEAIQEVELARKNINNNIEFRKKIIVPLITLLGKANQINVRGALSPNITINSFGMLQGAWELNIHDSIGNDTYENRTINIDGNEISYFNSSPYGIIQKAEYDSNNLILKFSVFRQNSGVNTTESFLMIKINDETFEGLLNNTYVALKKRIL